MAKYQINEIFYSLQGEGRWTGRPAVFVRFSGCNLACPFCDTDFHSHKTLNAEEIIDECREVGANCRTIILTGGEPTLQVDDSLIGALHKAGYWIAMETNGTHPYPKEIDWVTCSPKAAFVKEGEIKIGKADELKLVFDGTSEIRDLGLDATYHYLQPCDTGNAERNQEILKRCIAYIKKHPQWSLSLQMHKLVGIQ